MNHHAYRQSRPAAAVLIIAVAMLAASFLGGCSSGSWKHFSVTTGVRSDQEPDLMTMQLDHAVPVAPGETVRVRHLAGRIRVVPGDGDTINIEATVFARAGDETATRARLDDLKWVETRDPEGRREWTISWPRYARFHYSQDGPGFRVEADRYYPGGVTVTTRNDAGAITLFADLTITCPPDASLSVRNLAGSISTGVIHGDYALDTGVGGIDVEHVEGSLHADCSSGDINVAAATGSLMLDTGSGDITVEKLDGDGHLDTGSGDVTIVRSQIAKLHADTGSGDITIQETRIDRLHADTGSGNIELRDVAFEHFDGDTGSGDILIHSSLDGARELRADTGSGDVTIIAGPDAEFHLSADVGGQLRVDYEAHFIDRDGGDAQVVRGEGGARIRVDTGSGNLTLQPG